MGTKAVSAAQRQTRLTEVNSVDEVPAFNSDDEAAAFWSTHAAGPGFFDTVEEIEENFPTRARSAPVSIRFDADSLSRLKALARKRHKGYQTLLKEFVIERLYEEEKREGLVG